MLEYVGMLGVKRVLDSWIYLSLVKIVQLYGVIKLDPNDFKSVLHIHGFIIGKTQCYQLNVYASNAGGDRGG